MDEVSTFMSAAGNSSDRDYYIIQSSVVGDNNNDKFYTDTVQNGFAAERRNLAQVCRFAVKTLIDRSCFETIEEESLDFINFCNIFEHLLNHRIKNNNSSWIGKSEPQCFWTFIRKACRTLKPNCIASIELLENLPTSREKGRAWLRMALMEKRLADYMNIAIEDTQHLSRHYNDGAFMLSDDRRHLVHDLLGLNSIDFSFDLKEVNLSHKQTPVIDYTPYLQFRQCEASVYSDHAELVASLASTPNIGDNIQLEKIRSWKDRYDKLEKKYKSIVEQKGYLEELVRLRDTQLYDANQQRGALLINLKNLEIEARTERHQLERVILELQSQLATVKDDHLRLTRQIRAYLNIKDHRHRHQSDSPEHRLSDAEMQSMSSNDTQFLSADTRSIISSSSSLSVHPPDSQSMIPLAGSMTSLTTEKVDEALQKYQEECKTGASSSNNRSHSMVHELVVGKHIEIHDIPVGVEANEAQFERDAIDAEAAGRNISDDKCSKEDEDDIYATSDKGEAENEEDLEVGSHCTLDSETSAAMVHQIYNINPGIDVERSMSPAELQESGDAVSELSCTLQNHSNPQNDVVEVSNMVKTSQNEQNHNAEEDEVIDLEESSCGQIDASANDEDDQCIEMINNSRPVYGEQHASAVHYHNEGNLVKSMSVDELTEEHDGIESDNEDGVLNEDLQNSNQFIPSEVPVDNIRSEITTGDMTDNVRNAVIDTTLDNVSSHNDVLIIAQKAA